MTLAERLRVALAAGQAAGPILLNGDYHDFDPDVARSPAAVLVAVTDRLEPGVILTRRNESLRNHAGQIAFPGGRIDPEDDGPVGAALREAEEEISLPRDQVEIVGLGDHYSTITGYDVMPVVGVVAPDLRYVAHEAEVADVFEVPLAFLLNQNNHVEATTEWEGRERHYFEINWEGRLIWGATAAMIVNLSRRLQWTA